MRNAPAAPAAAPSVTKTAVNPALNASAVPTTSRRRRSRSATATPETYERKAGTSGSTQGEANDTAPASTARTSAAGESEWMVAAIIIGRTEPGRSVGQRLPTPPAPRPTAADHHPAV